MSSRLLARAQRSASTDDSRSEGGSLFEQLPGVPDGLCCHFEGTLNAGQIESLNAKISSALGEGAKFLFFDFAHIDDLTAAGVGFLVALKKLMRGKGGDLVLYGMRPKQQRFMETLGFRGFFSLALDLRYAMEYILGMKRDIFPIAAVCPACSMPLGIEGPGRSRCRACKAVLTVLADGSVELG